MNATLQILPLFLLFAACLGATIHHLWKGNLTMLPSFGWLILACLPFCLEFPFFDPASRITHGIGLCLFLAVIMGSDYGTHKILERPFGPVTQPDPRRIKILGYIFAAIFAVLSLSHLYSANNIPSLEWLAHGGGDEAQDITNRIHFSRSFAGSPILKYLYSFSTVIFAAPAILMLWKSAQRPAALVILTWALIYAIASMAKGPLVILALVLVTGTCMTCLQAQCVKTLRFLMVAGCVGLVSLTLINIYGPGKTVLKDLPQKYAAANAVPRPDMMLGDYMRQLGQEERKATTPPPVCLADYYIYRIILTPIEVSARWYEYFHRYPVQERMFSRSIMDSRLNEVIHPANAVGRWAYYDRYPKHYTQEAYAYASIDADAYGRYGVAGWLFAAFLYVFMRLWLAVFDDTKGMTQGIFSAVGATLLALLPASASIQALLIAQGLGMLMAIMFALKAWDFLRARHQPQTV